MRGCPIPPSFGGVGVLTLTHPCDPCKSVVALVHLRACGFTSVLSPCLRGEITPALYLGGVGYSANLIAIANASDRAWRGSRRSRQFCSPAPQRKFRTETV